MKYSWGKVYYELKKILVENVSFVGRDASHTADLARSFAFEVRETDRFHPYNSDGELSRALDRMPDRCNYRNIKSYWAFKNGKEYVADGLYAVLEEMEELVRDHYKDSWNFAPGYVKPVEIKFKVPAEDLADKVRARIMRVARVQ